MGIIRTALIGFSIGALGGRMLGGILPRPMQALTLMALLAALAMWSAGPRDAQTAGGTGTAPHGSADPAADFAAVLDGR